MAETTCVLQIIAASAHSCMCCSGSWEQWFAQYFPFSYLCDHIFWVRRRSGMAETHTQNNAHKNGN